VQYAEKFSDEWVILSGKFGIIPRDFAINGKYDKRLKATDGFRDKIRKQLETFISKGFSPFISLCGKDYSLLPKNVLNSFDLELITPLNGLKIGKRQKMIREALRKNNRVRKLRQSYPDKSSGILDYVNR